MNLTLSSDLVDLVSADAGDVRAAPRAMFLIAHPDDEALGAGARLSRLRRANFVFLTDGSPRKLDDALALGFRTQTEYALARRGEAHRALGSVGVDARQVHWLGAVDQEATCQLARLVRRVVRLVAQHTPQVLLTHPYEGGHPDHDAAAFIAHSACELVERAGGGVPIIIEMTSYHTGPKGLTFGEFLPNADREEITRVLSESERAAKQRLLAHYPTQARVLSRFPLTHERFRIAPDYDFAEPPCEGALFYESQNWSFNGSRWRTLARSAALELGLRGKSLALSVRTCLPQSPRVTPLQL